MRNKLCRTIQALQTIPVHGVSANKFVKYMEEETQLPKHKVRRMVVLALKCGVQHNILTVDKQGHYRLKHFKLSRPPKQKGAARAGRHIANSRAVAKSHRVNGHARTVAKPRRYGGGARAVGKSRRGDGHARTVAKSRRGNGNARTVAKSRRYGGGARAVGKSRQGNGHARTVAKSRRGVSHARAVALRRRPIKKQTRRVGKGKPRACTTRKRTKGGR